MKILLSGYFGFDNAGDEAIFESVVENFRRLHPDCVIRALVQDSSTAERLGVEPLPRKDLGVIWKTLRDSDLLVQGGGGLYQDTTGPASVFYYGGLLLMAQLCGCPSVIFCQGYGPVKGPLQKFFTRQAFRCPKLITVRDEESKGDLLDLGLQSRRVQVTADPALLLQPRPVEEMRKILAEEGLLDELGRSELPNGQLSSVGPLVAVTVRPWPGFELKKLAEALLDFRQETNARFLILPFHPGKDTAPSQTLVEHMGGEAHVLQRPLSPKDLTGILACCDMVIGMRLHSLILATVGNPPLYGLSYDPKVERFCRRAGAVYCNVEEISSERLLKEWNHVLQGRKSQRAVQKAAVSQMRTQAEKAFQASLAVGQGCSDLEVAQYFS